jgi:hypothetical protein
LLVVFLEHVVRKGGDPPFVLLERPLLQLKDEIKEFRQTWKPRCRALRRQNLQVQCP